MHKGRRLSYFTSHHGVINCQRDYCATSYSCKTCSNVGSLIYLNKILLHIYKIPDLEFVVKMRMFVYPSSGNSSERKYLFIEVTLNLVVFHLLFFILAFFTTVASLLLAFLSFNTGKFHTIAGYNIQSEGLLLKGFFTQI